METLLGVGVLLVIARGVGTVSQSLTLQTPNKHGYIVLADHDFNPRHADFLVFQVKACSDIHVGLQQIYKVNNPMYEIVVAAYHNSKTIIRRCAQCTGKATYNGRIADCTTHVSLWVSWRKGKICVGTGGVVGDSVLTSWTDPSPLTVNYVTVSTGWGATGDWIFNGDNSKLLFTFLKPNSKFNGGTAVSLVPGPTLVTCSNQCFMDVTCRGFSHHATDASCRLFDEVPAIVSLNDTVGWNTWIVLPWL